MITVIVRTLQLNQKHGLGSFLVNLGHTDNQDDLASGSQQCHYDPLEIVLEKCGGILGYHSNWENLLVFDGWGRDVSCPAKSRSVL